MRGADLIAQTLAKAGVDTIFSLSGNQIMPVYDACIDAKIRIIHTRHEAAAVFMADAYAQITGKIGVAMVTAGPGFGNSLGALFSAWQSESPVLLMSGDSPVSQDGKGAFQEIGQTAMSAPITKRAHRPTVASELGADLASLIRTALEGRPGPVQFSLPFDLLNTEVDATALLDTGLLAPSSNEPPAEFVQQAAKDLASAQRPVILAGPALNATRSGSLLADLESATGVPVVAMESPRSLIDPALGEIKNVLSQADLILCIGRKLDFILRFAEAPNVSEDCKLLLCDPDEDALAASAKNAGDRLAGSCIAGSREMAQALISAATPDANQDWLKEAKERIAAQPDRSGDLPPLHPGRVTETIQKVIDDANDPILIIDGGEFGQWSQAFLSADKRIINGPSGAIGGCLCYALGAKAAMPESDIFVLMGDGTAGFHFAEFETASRLEIPFVAIIGNDARWNAEYQIQMRDYGENRTYACELSPARYDQAAAGFGCHGENVEEPGELEAALRRAHGSGLPACVNIMIDGASAPVPFEH